MKRFRKELLNDKYLHDLLKEFWFSPCDAFLRAPEVTIWKNIKFKSPTLNIGCGDGRNDKYLFEGKTIDVAIDYDKEAIESAKTSGLYKKTILASASNMPFKNRSFNTVISNSTFEHIKNDIKAISEVSRVLKRKGRFIFTTTTDILENELKEIGVKEDKLKTYNKRVDHFHYRSVGWWVNLLNKNNLKVKNKFLYFPKENVRMWWYLYKLTVFKPYKRELWSYLKDSPYGKLVPGSIFANFYYYLLKSRYKKSFSDDGVWMYIEAVKK